LIFATAFAASNQENPDRVDFSVKCQDIEFNNRIMGIYAASGEEIFIEVIAPADAHEYEMIYNGVAVTDRTANGWRWTTPEKTGLHKLIIRHETTEESMMLHVFVLIPFSAISEGKLNGCRIGSYPSIPLKYKQRDYQNPKGLIEVTPENEETFISPNFKLKQFICKQPQDYPKYVVLSSKLLIKLELIIDALNENGIKCNSFKIMSGYRTPHYNEAIGNVKFSRHIYGTAADFFIDESPVDGEMDDINKDGKIDIQDAKEIYDVIESLSKDPAYNYYLGGLSAYKKNAVHGPFVHIDVRGYRARW
jgi:hypothetical protein